MSTNTVGLGELAALTGRTPRTIRNYLNDGVLPAPRSRGEYDLKGCLAAMVKYLDGMSSRAGSKQLNEALLRERVLKLQVERRVKEGSLLDRAAVEEVWSSAMRAIAAGLDTLGARVASELVDKSAGEIQDILLKETDRIRLEAYREIKRLAVETERRTSRHGV